MQQHFFLIRLCYEWKWSHEPFGARGQQRKVLVRKESVLDCLLMDCLLVHVQGWQEGVGPGCRLCSPERLGTWQQRTWTFQCLQLLMQLHSIEWELLSSPERLNNTPKVKQFQSRS